MEANPVSGSTLPFELELLPEDPELWLKVMNFLDLRGLTAIIGVCKALRRMGGDNSFWRTHYITIFRTLPQPLPVYIEAREHPIRHLFFSRAILRSEFYERKCPRCCTFYFMRGENGPNSCISHAPFAVLQRSTVTDAGSIELDPGVWSCCKEPWNAGGCMKNGTHTDDGNYYREQMFKSVVPCPHCEFPLKQKASKRDRFECSTCSAEFTRIAATVDRIRDRGIRFVLRYSPLIGY